MPTPSKGKRRDWTTAEEVAVRRMARDYSSRQIGEAIGRSQKAVQRFAQRYGIRLNQWGGQRGRLKFTAAQVRAVRDMAARGGQHKTIARGMGMSVPHANNIARGLKRVVA